MVSVSRGFGIEKLVRLSLFCYRKKGEVGFSLVWIRYGILMVQK